MIEMSDAEREEHIAACGRLMLKAHAEGDHAAARQWLKLQAEAVAARSPAQVARMESCYFAAEGDRAREEALAKYRPVDNCFRCSDCGPNPTAKRG